jgi:formate-dependent phosphoribosylglycinamide formyltransferase (GAR transformylase)
MNHDRIREVAAVELGLRTSRYRYAESLEEVLAGAKHIGLPCVVKPVMSSSGKGQQGPDGRSVGTCMVSARGRDACPRR